MPFPLNIFVAVLAILITALATWLIFPYAFASVEKSLRKLEPKEPKGRPTKDPHSFATDLGSGGHTNEQSISPNEVPDVHDSPVANDTSNTPLIESVIVLEVPLASIDGSIIKLGERALPGHFRLIDCNAFLDFHLLRVFQYAEFLPKELSYAAISYPWRDLQLSEGTRPPLGCFGVHGAEDADPITVGVLRTACVAARKFGASLLWLDRLCMIQSNKSDKIWQITHMFTMYAHANPCLVLPGGLVRLAHLNEPTRWIDRAWTLQEAAANPNREAIKCVYAFPHSTFPEFARNLPNFRNYSASFRSNLTESDNEIFMQHIIESGQSAACDLPDFTLHIHWMSETFDFADPVLSKDYRNLPVRTISAPAASLLRQALKVDQKINRQLLWMSAFVRTSSRPVDMIFSFMGLVGVQLQVADFGVNDRKGATIKLIQTLLERGEPAVWLFIAPELPPSPELSILPVFPETSVSGRAMIRTSEGLKPAFEEIGLKEPWRTHGAPKGVMSDDGYFTFSAKSAPALGGMCFV